MLAFGAGSFAVAAAALVAGDISAAYEKLRSDPSYQFSFADPPPPPKGPRWLLNLFEFIAQSLEVLAPLIRFLFWAGLALIVIGALYVIAREIQRRIKRARGPEDDAEIPVYRPAPALARALLEEADRLAAEGKYGEAARILLFRSIEDIQRHQPNAVRKAMTSREISRLSILTAQARTAFASIASAVERSHFAGRPIGAEVFAECRAAYSVFAAPGEWA
ncbi:MAG: hypothetical protein R3C58_04850 [Parvularculaceae bacterium]